MNSVTFSFYVGKSEKTVKKEFHSSNKTLDLSDLFENAFPKKYTDSQKYGNIPTNFHSLIFTTYNNKRIKKITANSFIKSPVFVELKIERLPKKSAFETLSKENSNPNATINLEDLSNQKQLDNTQIQTSKPNLQEPELPQCYKGKFYTYPISPAEKNDYFVCIANRDNCSIKWYPIGETIENFALSLGKTTMHMLSSRDIKVFQQEDHNMNFPDITFYNDQELKDKLEEYGLSQKGSREDLFKRLVDHKESPNEKQKVLNIDDFEINSKQANQKTFLKVAIAALSILALIGTHKKFGTLNPMNIYKQVFPKNIPQ
jgi:hypothetical protein